jgi:hypothetical protein
MRRRRLQLVLAGVVLLLVLMTVLFHAVPDDPSVGAADFAGVQLGMSLAQVESVLGGPAKTMRPAGPAPGRVDGVPSRWPWIFTWTSFGGQADITFDGNGYTSGGVVEKQFTPAAPDSWTGPLRRRLVRVDRRARAWWKERFGDYEVRE